MASHRVAQFSEAVALGQATTWARKLSSQFQHVVLFYVHGAEAQPLAVHGMGDAAALPTVSLVLQTPLRWCVEAASPVIGAGRSPGGGVVAEAFGHDAPRGYAVLPFVSGGQLLALIYLDNGNDPLPLNAVATLMGEQEEPERAQQAVPASRPRRRRERGPRSPGRRSSLSIAPPLASIEGITVAPESDARERERLETEEAACADRNDGDFVIGEGFQPADPDALTPLEEALRDASEQTAQRVRAVPAATEGDDTAADDEETSSSPVRRVAQAIQNAVARAKGRTQARSTEARPRTGEAADETSREAAQETSLRQREAQLKAERDAENRPTNHSAETDSAALAKRYQDDESREAAYRAEEAEARQLLREAALRRARAQEIQEAERRARERAAQEAERHARAQEALEAERRAAEAEQARRAQEDAAREADQRAKEEAIRARLRREAEEEAAREQARREREEARLAEQARRAMARVLAAKKAREEEQAQRAKAQALAEEQAREEERARAEADALAEDQALVDERALPEDEAQAPAEEQALAEELSQAEELVREEAKARAEEQANRDALRFERQTSEEALRAERRARDEAYRAEQRAYEERQLAEALAIEAEELSRDGSNKSDAETRARKALAEAEGLAIQRAVELEALARQREAEAETRAQARMQAAREREEQRAQQREATARAKQEKQRAKERARDQRSKDRSEAKVPQIQPQSPQTADTYQDQRPLYELRQTQALDPLHATATADEQYLTPTLDPLHSEQPASAKTQNDSEQASLLESTTDIHAWSILDAAFQGSVDAPLSDAEQQATGTANDDAQLAVTLVAQPTQEQLAAADASSEQQTATTAPARRFSVRRLWLSLIALIPATAIATLLALCSPPPREQSVELEVIDADNVATIGRALSQADVIRSAFVLSLMARFSGLDRQLRAGMYIIPPKLWTWEVLDVLHHGQVQTVRVTLPEGLTLTETANVWGQHGLVRPAEFIAAASDPQLLRKYGIEGNSAEGFLYPETYTVARGLAAKSLVETQVRAFFDNVGRMREAVSLSPQELYDRVIVASLVEREARDPAERPRIAGVFYNRLNRDMRLESCATVQYLLGKPKERLTIDDVRIPSPYNTYLHPGLPPGPIANPGKAAFEAALLPEGNDFLFFFAKDDGSHHHYFSRTYAEHQRAHRQIGAR